MIRWSEFFKHNSDMYSLVDFVEGKIDLDGLFRSCSPNCKAECSIAQSRASSRGIRDVEYLAIKAFRRRGFDVQVFEKPRRPQKFAIR